MAVRSATKCSSNFRQRSQASVRVAKSVAVNGHWTSGPKPRQKLPTLNLESSFLMHTSMAKALTCGLPRNVRLSPPLSLQQRSLARRSLARRSHQLTASALSQCLGIPILQTTSRKPKFLPTLVIPTSTTSFRITTSTIFSTSPRITI